MATLAVASVVLALASVYGGFWVDRPREAAIPPSASSSEPAAPTGPEDESDAQVDDGGQAVSPASEEGCLDAELVARAAYRRGLSRSRRGLYDIAAADLGIARRCGEGLYFYDDAVYYQARALHRSGAWATAQEAYEHLLSLTADEARSVDEAVPYRADAMRFLEQLRDGRAEEQVAR